MDPSLITSLNDFNNKKVVGFKLVLNHLIFLVYKCLIIKFKKKFILLVDFFLPLVLFYILINNTFKEDKRYVNEFNNDSNNDLYKQNGLNSSDQLFCLNYKNVYYNYEDSSERIAKSIIKSLSDKLNGNCLYKSTFIKTSNSSKEVVYDFYHIYYIYFPSISSNNKFNYSISVLDNFLNYEHLKFKNGHLYNYNLKQDLYTLHYNVLSSYLKLDTLQNNFNADLHFEFFEFITEEKKTEYFSVNNLSLFSIFVAISFLGNIFIILDQICDEKKNKSFEFLKLMGAKEYEIYISHFLVCYFFMALISIIFLGYFYFIKQISFFLIITLFIFTQYFIMHSIVISFFISSFFTYQLYANIFYQLFFVLQLNFKLHSQQNNFLIYFKLLHPVFYFNYVTSLIDKLNSTGTPILNFSNWFVSLEEFYNFNLFNLFCLNFFYIILIFNVSMYLIKTWPLQDLPVRPFLYFLYPSYWNPDNYLYRPYIKNQVSLDRNEIEQIPSNKKKVIILNNVYKSYFKSCLRNQYKVLENLDFFVCENEITVLLGHNGAGKSTTMNLITGISSVDNGEIIIKDYLVSRISDKYKSSVGYCPQENIFYKDLTVYQNLKLAAVLRMMPLENLDSTINLLVNQVNLKDKLHVQSSKLSEGMKRRLCLAIGVIGFIDILIFDEPTSGLDPENRRKIWTLLLELRKYKTIFLTTHFLEEADILGDRIAIMHQGNIKCYGSSLFLKKLHNIGYLLRVELENFNKIDDLKLLIEKFIPKVIFEKQSSKEIFFKLSVVDKNDNLNLKIAKLFDFFEENKKRMNIVTWGLTNTSLEDIFLKIGELQEDENNLPHEILNLENFDHIFKTSKLTGFQLYLSQIHATIMKRNKLMTSNWIKKIYSLLMPVLILSILCYLIELIYNYFIFGKENFGVDFTLRNNYPNKKIALIKSTDSSNYFWKNISLLEEFYGLKVDEIDLKTFIQRFNENKKINKFDYLFALTYTKNMSKPLILLDSVASQSFIPLINIYFTSLAKNVLNKEIQFDLHVDVNFLDNDEQNKISNFIVFLYVSYWVTLFLLCILFSSWMVSVVPFLNAELKNKAYFIQRISGLSSYFYWILNYIYDFLTYFVSIILALFVACFIVNQKNLLFVHHLMANYLIVFALVGLNFIAYTYFFIVLNLETNQINLIVKNSIIFSSIFFFKEISNEFLSLLILFFVPIKNLILSMNYYLTQIIKQKCEEQFKDCSLINVPEYNVYKTYLILILSTSFWICAIFIVEYNKKSLEIVKERISKFIHTFKKVETSQELNIGINQNYLNHLVDDNVENEIKHVQETIRNKEFVQSQLIINDLTKVFNQTLYAVDHLSFTVKPNECFGFLGINGAGKSTTFSMLTGEITPTSGSIYFGDQMIKNNLSEYYKHIAYCPQVDIVTEHLSVEFLLKYYAKIAGIKNKNLNEIVNWFLFNMNLNEERYKKFQVLSGGNKRKLTTAIALITMKKLILLDEPTTAVDPVSKRKIWATFEKVKNNNSSLLLTSHSMNECEHLCDRISVMASGKLRCLGSFSRLREKYSQGFSIIIKLKEFNNNSETVCSIKERMIFDYENNVNFKEYYMNTMLFIIMKNNFSWSLLFRKMENLKNDYDLDDYMICETNLEQIFLSFAA